MQKDNILLFNPRSADAKHRIPNSILQVGSSLKEAYNCVYVDGNLEQSPLETIFEQIEQKEIQFVGMTVMPGPQLKQAIPFSKAIRERHPQIPIVWGGYFASNQYKVSLNSGFVDYVINGPAEDTIVELIDSFKADSSIKRSEIPNLIYKKGQEFISTRKIAIPNMEKLAAFDYDGFHQQYSLQNYLAKTFMGRRTFAYHSSFGCPFTCSFCAVVPIYNARWKGLSAQRVASDILNMQERFGIDAIEFHDNNFFTSRKRVVEFAELIKDKGISWWGEGRIDTINKYSDEDLTLMKEAGLKMIFLGAETGNDDILKQMDKGGTQTGAQIKEFAERLAKFGIIPEYSFVLGMPADTSSQVSKQINEDIKFIRTIKKINPNTEIIIYVYSPVANEESDLHKEITEQGFVFPQTLEDWLSPAWERFDLRKNPLTPWLTKKHVNRIKNFETVLNAYYPTQTDFKIKGWKTKLLKLVSWWRYQLGFYAYPYEIKLLHKIWRYRQPEEQGFYSE